MAGKGTAKDENDEDALDTRTRRLYVWAIVCEAIVIVALWAFKRVFS